MKEIEKYVSYYLLVYFAVLSICGFFQYFYECQGQSLACAFSMDGINTIITTTAYVLTPIVAIIGFLSWKKEFNSQLTSNLAHQSLQSLDNNFNIQYNLITFLIENQNHLAVEKNSYEFNSLLNDSKRHILEVFELISRLSIIDYDQ